MIHQRRTGIGVRCAYYGSAFRAKQENRGCRADSYFWQRLLASVAVGQIELAFRYVEDFLKLDPAKIVEPIKALELEVPSLHMAHADVADIGKDDGEFLPVFFKTLPIMLELGAKLLVVHPKNGKVEEIGTLVDGYLAEVLEDGEFEITLCWETFSGRKRFIGPVETIAEFVENRPFQAICYDTAHVGETTAKVLEDIEQYGALVKVWHLSNWSEQKRHLPLFHPEGRLNFEPIIKAIQQHSPDAVVTLEGYLLGFRDLLPRDVLRLKRMMSPE